MPRRLRTLLLVTDLGFLMYWALTALMVTKLIDIPTDWLFKDYADPNIVAWNWSFMPLDMLASVTGLIAVAQSGRGDGWQTAALISLVLTFCAGFMAISFWTFQQSFDPSWWAPNLFLTLWPLTMFKEVHQQP
jgi:Family of unknown function (DUF5360)